MAVWMTQRIVVRDFAIHIYQPVSTLLLFATHISPDFIGILDVSGAPTCFTSMSSQEDSFLMTKRG